MSTDSLPDNTPGTEVFPQFDSLYSLVAPEVEGLTESQLSWDSEQWEWAKWNIRRQVSHMASFIPGWLLRQWGKALFPNGFDELGELADLVPSPSNEIVRWLDESKFRDMSSILERAGQGNGAISLRSRPGDPGVHAREGSSTAQHPASLAPIRKSAPHGSPVASHGAPVHLRHPGSNFQAPVL